MKTVGEMDTGRCYYNIEMMQQMLYCIGAVHSMRLQVEWCEDLIKHYQAAYKCRYTELRLSELHSEISELYSRNRKYIFENRCNYDTGYGYAAYGGENGKWYCLLRKKVIENESPNCIGFILRHGLDCYRQRDENSKSLYLHIIKTELTMKGKKKGKGKGC